MRAIIVSNIRIYWIQYFPIVSGFALKANTYEK